MSSWPGEHLVPGAGAGQGSGGAQPHPHGPRLPNACSLLDPQTWCCPGLLLFLCCSLRANPLAFYVIFISMETAVVSENFEHYLKSLGFCCLKQSSPLSCGGSPQLTLAPVPEVWLPPKGLPLTPRALGVLGGTSILSYLPSQESQAIPLVSVASVAAGKAKRQASYGPEEPGDPGTCPWDPPPPKSRPPPVRWPSGHLLSPRLCGGT